MAPATTAPSRELEAFRRPKHFGRPRRLSDAQCAQLVQQLNIGALAAGFPTELWTLPQTAQLIEQRFAGRLRQPTVRRLPRYMVLLAVVGRDMRPRNANNKVDRARLKGEFGDFFSNGEADEVDV